jgi:hypothetical protein
MADTPEARMGRLRSLVAADLDVVADLASRLQETQRAAASPPTDAERMAMAGYIHHAYTGIEAAIERIVREIDGSLPEGPRSHRDLVDSARVAIAGIRPAVIGGATAERLALYVSFRHAYRHGYAMRLEWARLRPLVDDLPLAVEAVRADLDAFFHAATGGPA